MPTPKVKAYLENQGIDYETITYDPAYDAQHVAAAAHISGKLLAKTVIIKADDALVMAVVPADTRVDRYGLRDALGLSHAGLARESDFKGRFDDCELGAMPPFGPLYGVDVYIDHSLTQATKIVFRAGTHGELIRMAYADFERIAKPHVMALAYRG